MVKAVLLVNLGTPDSPAPADVYRYLIEFLTDGRVIDLPWVWRQLLVRGVIVPRRYRQSASSYAKIWQKEGSPLLIQSRALQKELQAALGEKFHVELAMRYQKPSLKLALERLQREPLEHLIVIPLFPQYASATTGSILQVVFEALRRWNVIPKISCIEQFAVHPRMIEAFAAIGCKEVQEADKVLFSFHGLPQRQADKISPEDRLHCYLSQSRSTAEAIATRLKLEPQRWTLSFQSRLGKEPWLAPYTDETLVQLARQGYKKVAVFTPSFVCDCLETSYEIGVENAHLFKEAGGEKLTLIPSLNAHPLWVQTLKELVLERD